MRRVSLGYNAVPASAEKAILDVFRSGQFSPGPKVREFEEQWAKAHGAKHAVFVNSGTDALRLSLLALKEKYGWKDGDEVAVPALTFVASVNVILQAGLRPFFVDVGMNDYLINPHNFQRRIESINSRVRAIMPVHLFGQACGDYIYDLAKRYKMAVIEDSCETVLNIVRGDVSCHSTYMAHHVTTGVGGFAVTNDSELNILIRSYANHGRNANYLPGYSSTKMASTLLRSRFQFDRAGYSCRGTEFEAVLGLSQMAGLKKSVNDRRSVFADLVEALKGFEVLTFLKAYRSTCMMFPMVLKENSGIDKYDLCLHLEKAGIETRDMMPITSQPCFKNIVNEEDFPVAKEVNKNGFYIACNPLMTKKDVQHTKKTVEAFLQK